MRPIDADELCKWLRKPTGFLANCEDCTSIDCVDCIVEEAICNAPTLDYEPVRHSKWKYYHKQNRAVCMACSFERDLDADFGRAICCPNCGTKMDGGKENGT